MAHCCLCALRPIQRRHDGSAAAPTSHLGYTLTPDDRLGHEPASRERSRDEDAVTVRIDHARGGFPLAAASRVPHARIMTAAEETWRSAGDDRRKE
jgi:hypothetical protein